MHLHNKSQVIVYQHVIYFTLLTTHLVFGDLFHGFALLPKLQLLALTGPCGWPLASCFQTPNRSLDQSVRYIVQACVRTMFWFTRTS